MLKQLTSKKIQMLVVFWAAVVVSISGCLKTRDTASTTTTTSAWFTGATSAKNLGGSPSAVKVAWTRADRSTSGYNVYSLRANATTGSSEWTLVGSVDADQTSYTDSESLYEGQIYTYKVQAVDALTGLEDGNTKQVSTVTFFGINGVSITGKTTATVYLSGNTGAFNEIHIYAVPKNGSGTATMVAKASGVVGSINVTGLRSGVHYKFYARAYMSYLGAEDGNEYYNYGQTYSDSFGSGKTSDTTYYYRGVLNVQGFGYAPNATSGPTSRQINLTWLPFSNGTSATKYRVVRSTTTSVDMTATSSCTLSSTSSCRVCEVTGSQYCEDTALAAPPQTYYYAVSVIKTDSSGAEYVEELPCQLSADCSNMSLYTVKAHVPPDYMVLVQRDAANYEMCLNINASSDPRHNQRCLYTGLGATPTTTGPSKPVKTYDTGYYDFGYNLFVDRYKVACNWTRSSSKCGPYGCTGILSKTSSQILPPGTVDVEGNTTEGVDGDVFYGQHTYWWSQPTCYYKKSGSWVGVATNATSLTDSEVLEATSNDPQADKHNPPLLYVSQAGAYQVCNANVTDYGRKRLLRHREYIVSTALPYIPGEPNAILSAAQAFNGPFSTACNPSGTWPTNTTEWMASSNAFLGTKPSGTQTNQFDSHVGIYRLIGNNATSGCLSRFGIQDPFAPSTYFSDMFIRTNSTGVVATVQGASSSYDTGNLDHGSFTFDGTAGPLFSNSSSLSVNGFYPAYLNSTAYTFCSSGKAIASFIPPLGLPVCTWNGGTQTLRNMNELRASYIFGSGSAAFNSDSFVGVWNDTTMSTFAMASGMLGRFSANFTVSASVDKYGNVMCGVEAE